MLQWIKAIGAGKRGSRDLSYNEAAEAAHSIARGDSTEAQCAAFLMALRMKGEVDEEFMAFVDVFRTYCMPYTTFSDSLNCAGPYQGRHYFPISLAVSLLLASVGFPQVLHGSDSLSPNQGTSLKELLEGLSINVELTEKAWEAVFFHIHIGFLWTDRLCTPIGRLRDVREQLGLQTVMNTVEKVINPLRSMNILIGVHHRSAMELLIPISVKSGFQTAYIIQGIEGSEDLPLHKNSTIRIVTPWGDESRLVEPKKFGFTSEPLEPLDKAEQISMLQRVIGGDDSQELKRERDHIVFNAGLRLMWFDKVGSYEEGFQLAAALLQRKEALKVLLKWQEYSKRLTVSEPKLASKPKLKAN
jgi:anthranilate phosphoribosyltransferase